MFRFLADHNFNDKIVEGLRASPFQIDIVRARDVGLSRADDPSVLEWATMQNRIVLTHDRATMPLHARQRMNASHPLAGLFIISNQRPVGQVIQDMELIAACSEFDEWRNRVIYLPL